MNSESKTTEDILREMRKYADQLDNDGDITGADFRDFANQLEAAMKREKVEAVTIAATKAVNLTDEKWRRDIVNAAAMRKALDKIHLIATTNINECVGDESDIHIVNLANAALAAPPRNCDRFGSYEDALDYWREHVECAEDNGSFDVWLMARAEGGAKCIDGLRGDPDCNGCAEHCEVVRRRNCIYWSGDHCAYTKGINCPTSCERFRPYKQEGAPK